MENVLSVSVFRPLVFTHFTDNSSSVDDLLVNSTYFPRLGTCLVEPNHNSLCFFYYDIF